MSTVTLNVAALRRVTRSDPVAADLMDRGERVAARQVQLAPRSSGRMARAIEARMAKDDDGLVCYIGPWGVWYAWFPEFGTFNRPAEPFLRPSVAAAQ